MPSTPGSGLKDLIDDARRRHEDTRPEMLRALVKLYVQAPDHGPAEQARFATLARRLFDSVDVPVAAKHVREIAARTDLPRQLVLHLARGPLAVAGPMLRLSPVLTDDDLIELARSAAPDHRAAIGARRDVSPDLAKRLAALLDEPPASPAPLNETETTAEPEVRASHLASNPGIEPPGVALPSEREPLELPAEPAPVAAPAEETALLPQAAPARASEATPDLAFFGASPEERTALLARLVTLPPLPLAERVGSAAETVTEALLDAAKTDDKAQLAALLAEALDLAPATARQIVGDGSGQALAVAARVLGLSLAILSRMLFRLHPATGRSAGEMTRLAEMFDSLPLASAQQLIAQWRGARRAVRERAEDVPPIRSYAVARPAATAAEAEESRQRG